MEQNTTYVAFDTSKETIAVALAEGGRRGEVRFFGTIANQPEAVRKLVDSITPSKRRGVNRVEWNMRVKPPRVPRSARHRCTNNRGQNVETPVPSITR